ncbi:MAG: hypothetical protein H6757_01980 [Candidatus Omnitrophica bacterium]|nr:hypothetical protein [Candidatus Omnitrophota bacterium]
MKKTTNQWVAPEQVLSAVYGKTSLEIRMSENRRDEVIAAAIFTSFLNQEFGTRFRLPSNYRQADRMADAEGIDLAVLNTNGRVKNLQIKGIHIQRSIERRRRHLTKGSARITSSKFRRLIERDSEELTRVMKDELVKIVHHDYGGLYLLIHVQADFATQTSLEIAIKNNRKLLLSFKSKEVWFLRNVPVRAIRGKRSASNCYAYKLIKVAPYRHTYGYSFAL